MEFVLPYIANRNRGDNLQHSDDEESQPQSENTDTLASENLGSCNVESVTEENYDVENENNDGHEDIDRTEDTAGSVKNTSFVKKQISKPPPKKMKKKKHEVASLIQRSIEQPEQRAKERAIEREKLEDSKSTTPKMPPASQHFVRTEIFEVVSQNEASLLNIPQPPYEEHQFQTPPYYDLTDVSLNSYSSESGSSLTSCHESRNVSSARSAENRFRLANLNNEFTR